MTKDVDNIKRVIGDIRFLIATGCCDETIQARIEGYISEAKWQKTPIDSVVNCNQQCEWKAGSYDHIGTCLTEYCEACGAKRDCL